MNESLAAVNVDSLSGSARQIYDRGQFKLFLSFIYAALAIFFLAMCVVQGGKSAAEKFQVNIVSAYDGVDDNVVKSYVALTSGWGKNVSSSSLFLD